MSEPEILSENDLGKLCELAEEVMETLCTAEESWNYMSLAREKDFRQNVLSELQELPIEAIKSKYLSGFLPKARDALRKGLVYPDFVLSDGIPDSLIDKIFTLTWLGKLRWWVSLCEFVEKTMRGRTSHDFHYW